MKARMKMRLIDADALIEKIKYSSHDDERVRIDVVTGCLLTDFVSPTIDPVHAAGACYCKECIYSTQKHIPYDDAYYCKLHRDLMPLNGFCNEGRKDDIKNG